MLLVYRNGEIRVDGYKDSDFQSDINDRTSTLGFIITFNGETVSWKNSKQSTTTDSTTEADYVVALEATKEAV